MLTFNEQFLTSHFRHTVSGNAVSVILMICCFSLVMVATQGWLLNNGLESIDLTAAGYEPVEVENEEFDLEKLGSFFTGGDRCHAQRCIRTSEVQVISTLHIAETPTQPPEKLSSQG